MATLFLTHSIYHILYSLSVIYKSKDESLKYIVLASRNNKDSYEILSNVLSLGLKWTEQIKIIDIPKIDKEEQYTKPTLKVIHEIKHLPINEFVMFNEDSLLAIHLGQHFYGKKIKVALAQDGMKAYAYMNKIAIRYCTLRSIEYYQYCKKNNFSYSPLFISMKYGNSYFVNKFYVSNQHRFKFGNRKEIKEVKLSPNVLDAYVKVTNKKNLEFEKNTLFFASSLIKWSEAQINVETKILNTLKANCPNTQIVIKLHPRVSKEVKSYYRENTNYILITDNIPAEVYLTELKNCILLSAYSGVALFEGAKNNNLKRYWLYPLYDKSLKVLSYSKLIHPDDNIIIISNWEELEHINFNFYEYD